MTRSTRNVVIYIALMGAVVGTTCVLDSTAYNKWQQERMVKRVLGANPTQLLIAGRTLLASRPGFVGEISPSSSDVPGSIRSLKPTLISLRTNSLRVDFSDASSPFGIIICPSAGNPPAEPKYGLRQWMDGLWVYDDGQLESYGQQVGSSQGMAEKLALEQVLAGYAQYFPEAKRVPAPAKALLNFSGVYSDKGPSGLGLSGRNLYLFPDGRFILTEWADIMPETALMEGAWSFQRECLSLSASVLPKVPVDLMYVPLRFADSNRDVLVLMGTPNGVRMWNGWVTQIEPEIRKARRDYDADVRIRGDFRFKTSAEETLYVTFFHGTYARVREFVADDWKNVRQALLLRLQPSGGSR